MRKNRTKINCYDLYFIYFSYGQDFKMVKKYFICLHNQLGMGIGYLFVYWSFLLRIGFFLDSALFTWVLQIFRWISSRVFPEPGGFSYDICKPKNIQITYISETGLKICIKSKRYNIQITNYSIQLEYFVSKLRIPK